MLAEVFEDGYTSENEIAFLQMIVSSDTMHIDEHAKALLGKLIEEKVYTQSQFARFQNTHQPLCQALGLGTRSIVKPAFDVQLVSLHALEKGAFQLQVMVDVGETTEAITIVTPDQEGNGGVRSRRDALVAWVAFVKFLQGDIPTAEVFRTMEAMEAVERITLMPKEEAVPTSTPISQNPSITVAPPILHQTLKEEPVTIIQGLRFKGALDATLRQEIEEEFSRHPKYLIQAFADLSLTVLVFEPSELYPKLLDSGQLKEPPLEASSYHGDPSGPYIFSDRSHGAISLMHELFHALVGQSSPELTRSTSRSACGPLGRNPGVLDRLYQGAKRRVTYYPEEAFATTYQSHSVYEYEAEGGVVFYRDRPAPGFAGTKDELQREDPVLYLLFLQMDGLLEAYYSGKSTLPYWFAFTETARIRAEAYLAKHSDEQKWNDADRLEKFRSASPVDLGIATDELAMLRTWQHTWQQVICGSDEETYLAAPIFQKLRIGDQVLLGTYHLKRDNLTIDESVRATLISIEESMATFAIDGTNESVQISLYSGIGLLEHRRVFSIIYIYENR